MKKILVSIITGSFLLYNIAFSINLTEVKTNLETTYSTLSSNSTKIYNKYISLYSDLENKIQTGDYKILCEFTGLNLSGLKENIDDKYAFLNTNIINDKHSLSAQIDNTKSKFDAGLITTGVYESKLEDISAQISGYNSTFTTKIQTLGNTLSGDIASYNTALTKKLHNFETKIKEYKKLVQKIKNLTNIYQQVKSNKNKLEKIVGISNKIVNDKSEEIKTNINNYFSDYVTKEFQKYAKQDTNINYFLSGMNIKKQLVLGYISDKMDGVIENTIKNYFPNIDFISLDSGYQSLITKNIVSNIPNNITGFNDQINTLYSQLENSNKILNDYLNKFGNKTDETNVLKKLKLDVIEAFKGITKIVQDDIKQTFSSRLEFVKIKEKQEQDLIALASKTYLQSINSTKLVDIKSLKTTINSYKTIVILPSNQSTIDFYLLNINKKIDKIKNKDLLDRISVLSKKIDSLQIGNNFNEIKKLRNDINNLELPQNLKIKKTLLLNKLLKKENLNKLFISGAIRYYYKNGDLTNKVANILMKYYKKFEKAGKTNTFMQKIEKAFDKLVILEDNLQNDKRSYYIIMIHNGLIEFKSQLK